jgi:hypothetical protein
MESESTFFNIVVTTTYIQTTAHQTIHFGLATASYFKGIGTVFEL